MPPAGGFLSAAAEFEDEAFLPITVFFCGDCGLVQIEEQIDPDVLFRTYAFSTSTIPALVRHFSDYADFIAGTLKARTVVEFGCNDGALMENLRRHGVSAMGVDIAENITEIARQKGLDVVQGYFTPAVAEDIAARLGRVDLVTGSNCFAHNADPGAILEAARTCLKEDGLFVVEVMYAGDLLDKLQWDTLYHEHLAVYSLSSLRPVLARHGFTVIDVHHLPMHAGSLRVLATPSANVRPHQRVADMLALEQRQGLADGAAWQRFGDAVRRQVALVGRTMAALGASQRVWAYGASGRATMWLNAAAMTCIGKVVDSSPLRAGRLMPGLHQPIVPPAAMREDPPDYVLITAWNYADAIRAKEDWYPGTWVLPLPRLTFF